jgi:hypothetical protein
MYEALVAAEEYEQCEGNTSMMSGQSSDVSVPSRGWASVAASVQGDPASALMARTRGFHVCFRRDHFLIDCPLLPPEVKQAITNQRTQQIQKYRGALPGRVNPPAPSPSATSFTNGVAPFTNGVAPRPSPHFTRSAYIPTPTWGTTPRYANSGRSLPSHRDCEPRPTDGPKPGGAYQYGYADGGKLCGRRLETGVLPELPVTRAFTTKQLTPRRILSRPVKKGLLQV